MKQIFFIFTFLTALLLRAHCQGPTQSTALVNLQRANVVEGSRAGQFGLTDANGRQRYAQYVEVDLVPITYTPPATGNTQNYSEFVTTTGGDIYYIDWQGRSIKLWDATAGGGSTNDYDWLEIGNNQVPNNIADSIYTSKYAAVNMRRVWPNAQFLIGDSTSTYGANGVAAGDRSARWGFVRMLDGSWSSIGQEGNNNSIRLGPGTQAMKIQVAAGPSPSQATAPFRDIASFRVDSLIRLNDYKNTRVDTNAVVNFLYTDEQGFLRSNNVSVLDNTVASSNIYYVGKQFSGLANSTNPEYTKQLAKAIRGDLRRVFPDPWSALERAKSDISTNVVSSAIIYILPGQSFTYGDATSSNNGQADFTLTAFAVDKTVTSGTKAQVLLNHPNVEYYFSEGSSMSNHCSTYPIPLFNLTGTIKEVIKVSGKGNFYNYFGESRTIEAEFITSTNNKAELFFEANSVNMQQWHIFRLTKCRLANIEVSNITTAGAMIVEFNNENVADTVTINFKSDIIKSGEGFFGPYVDYWYGILLQNGGPTYANFDIGQIEYKEAGSFVRTSMSITNSIVNIKIDNAKHIISSQGYLGGSNGCFIDLSTALSPTGLVNEQNNQFNIFIGNYVGDYPVLRWAGLAKSSGAANNIAAFHCGSCVTKSDKPTILIPSGGAGFGNVNPSASFLKLTGSYKSTGNNAIYVTGVTSRIDIDASLSTDLASGVWNSNAINVSTINLNGTLKNLTSNTVFAAGSTLPVIGELSRWDNTLKKYIVVLTNAQTIRYDNNRLPATSEYWSATGLSANESRANYEFNDVDITRYKYSNTPLGIGGEYGGWLANGTNGDSISVSAPFWVVIGDSQAAGQPGNGTSRLHPSGVATFSPNIQDTYGTLAYTLRQRTNMRFFNHGIGNQNSTQVWARWDRDVLAKAKNVGDSRGNKTLQRRPNGVVIVIGANDISQGVPLTTITNNMLNMAKSARENGIQCVFLNCPGDTSETAINYRRMDSLNFWMSSGILQAHDASVIDYNKWWKNTTYNDNKHPQSLIVDNIHPSQIGYDSLANFIFRSAKIPVLDSVIFYTHLSSAGFSGYSRPTGITLTGKAYTLANQERVAIPITQKFTWDSIQVKITASTSVTGTSYTGFSHIMWHFSNDTLNVVSKKYPVHNGYNLDNVKTVMLDFPYISGGTIETLSVTVPGVKIGDIISLGVNGTFSYTSLLLSAHVSSSNMVTVQCYYIGTTGIDPPPLTVNIQAISIN